MSVYLLVLCLALVQQEGKAQPEPRGCSNPQALRVAEEALDQINLDRAEGYVLKLARLYDVSNTAEETEGGSLYKMTIDVVETNCHVISRKPAKKCAVRHISDLPVYGECELSAIFNYNITLQNYSCALHQVPVQRDCPDCIAPIDLHSSEADIAAKLSLQKFNGNSNLKRYFALENITRANYQWFMGKSYYVEFIIVETVCSKETNSSELSGCSPVDSQSAYRGLCGGLYVILMEMREMQVPLSQGTRGFVTVECKIFETKAVDLKPRDSLGTIVYQPATARALPEAILCPGQYRNASGIRNTDI